MPHCRNESLDHLGEIAAKIEAVRERCGMSIAELAHRTEIDRKRLWYVLRGNRAMRADEFVRLCAVLDLEIYHFLTKSQARELRINKLRTVLERQYASEVKDTLKGPLRR